MRPLVGGEGAAEFDVLGFPFRNQLGGIWILFQIPFHPHTIGLAKQSICITVQISLGDEGGFGHVVLRKGTTLSSCSLS
ncbi:Uncharacterised protein [Mycobacterium tuberculosis]|nr:Uncharacterised protein [Mycobacterium tuberculosis]